MTGRFRTQAPSGLPFASRAQVRRSFYVPRNGVRFKLILLHAAVGWQIRCHYHLEKPLASAIEHAANCFIDIHRADTTAMSLMESTLRHVMLAQNMATHCNEAVKPLFDAVEK